MRFLRHDAFFLFNSLLKKLEKKKDLVFAYANPSRRNVLSRYKAFEPLTTVFFPGL